MSDTAGRLPAPDTLSELLEAEKTRALQTITLPWVHFLLSVVCAAGVWLPNPSAARAVAVVCVLAPGVLILSRTGALTRVMAVYTPDEDSDADDPEAISVSRMAGRMLAITNAIVSLVLAVVTLLVPLTWLRVALPLLCLWFVVDVFRQRRSRLRAQEVIARAERQPWYPEYRRHIEQRRASVA
ncbi:hypothetical protein [Streptomyces sp. NPDC006551]|uniref:hypothetical protein n=1 Tax=Streptomyces sp. NPDC006551 TaxID=3157178 RepID=UPI00339E3710